MSLDQYSCLSNASKGYHVQITARSDRDLTPESILQKVSDASGAKYSGTPVSSGSAPPPIASKPVFMPTKVGGGAGGFNPLGSSSRSGPSSGPVDGDGWGVDAPPVTRSQLEKVQSAYQPTRVNLAELRQKQEPSRFNAPLPESNAPDVVRGAYQPVGKVDIAALRRQAKETGQDDRPTIVKGAYEPIGKVDIAAIRARAQPAAAPSFPSADEEEAPKPLADRSAAFQQSERLTSMPKPKVASKFGGASSFTGTRAPVPVGFSPTTNPTAAPVGAASRTFADQGGKTPAQIWAEKKAKQGGAVISPSVTGTTPVQAQPSGEGGWKSGYTGKSWAAVQTTRTGQSVASNQSDQKPIHTPPEEEEEAAAPGIGSIRDRFAAAPPPMDIGSKPNAAARSVPPPPEPEEEEEEVRPASPIRIIMPVSRQAEPEPEPLPVRQVPAAAPAAAAPSAGKKAVVQYDYEKAEDNEIELKEGELVTHIEMVDEDWWMGRNAAGDTGLFPSNYVEIFEGEPPAQEAERAASPPSAPALVQYGATATAEYEYEAVEDNELSFPEGAKILNVVSFTLHVPKIIINRNRNSLIRIGGMESSMARRDCSQPTMLCWTSSFLAEQTENLSGFGG
jgi:drebrin-like protein